LYVYLAAFDESQFPQPGQLAEIERMAAALDASLADFRSDVPHRAGPLIAPLDTNSRFALMLMDEPPAQLVLAFAECGISLRQVADLDALREAMKPVVPVAVIAACQHIASLSEALDALARRLPATANLVLVGVSSGGADDRLRALLGGCEVFVERLDDPKLVSRVVELARAPDTPFRVLLVDDDASTRIYLRAVLQHAGMEVCDTGDPSVVEEQIAQFKPDLLLVDLFMPDTDGMTLTMRLRQHAEWLVLPIVFLSGEHGDQARLQAIRAGGDDFLTKPVRPRGLVAAVRSRIQRARAVRRQLLSTASAAPRSGRLRRGEFLSLLAQAPQANVPWRVLLAVKVDQADALHEKLGQAGAYELEQSIDLRLIEALEPGDVFALWQEFGFGILVQRDSREAIIKLAAQLNQAVADRPFKVQGQDERLTLSVGFALAPSGETAGNTDRWTATAFAAQAVAHRLGGNRYDGILEQLHGKMSAERVMMIREAVKHASSSLNLLVDFQPMLQLHGDHNVQYQLIAKLRDQRAPLAGVRRDEFLEAARAAGVMAAIDRMSLFRAFEAIEEQRTHGKATRVVVPMDIASFDQLQLAWLVAELRRRHTYASSLATEFEADVLRVRPALNELVRRLSSFGIGIVLSDQSLAHVDEFQSLPFNMLRIPHSQVAALSTEEFVKIFGNWRASGRATIVDGISDVTAVSHLWSMGVEYVQGDALATAGPRLDYESAQMES